MPKLKESWPLLHFEKCIKPTKCKYSKLKKKAIHSRGRIPVIDQGEGFIAGYTDDLIHIYPESLPVIIFGDHTRRIKYIDFEFAVGADGTKILHAIDLLEPRFLYHYLCTLNLESQGYSRHYRFLKEVDVPLPPLPEQKLIVAKLEKLLDRVNSCQQRLAKIPVLLKRFRQSVLAAACSGRLTADWREENPDIPQAVSLISEIKKAHVSAGGHKRGNAASPTEEAHDLTKEDLPENWEIAEMRDIVIPDRPITYGILKPGPDVPDGIPYIRVADFPNDKISIESIRRTTREIYSTFSRSKLREGDILLSIRGTVGRVCIVPHELENANITQDSARLSIQPLMNTNYIAWVLRATTTQNRIQKAIKGVAIRGINIGDVRALQIPIPPLPEQEEIVRRVESLFSLADRIESRLAKATDQVNRLTSSILAKAFRGELVPQDLDDEPASVLLERIQQTRKPTEKKKKSIS